MRPIDKLRRTVAGKQGFDEAVARKAVADFIEGLRELCEEEGPWAFIRFLEVDEDIDPRHLAYLVVWREGPPCQVWPDLQRFDAIDLAVDRAAEGFEAHLRVRPTEA